MLNDYCSVDCVCCPCYWLFSAFVSPTQTAAICDKQFYLCLVSLRKKDSAIFAIVQRGNGGSYEFTKKQMNTMNLVNFSRLYNCEAKKIRKINCTIYIIAVTLSFRILHCGS